ncbi:fibronectin type III domain-containing protein 10 [Astyanax mexicanus]|uniref:Fibronectin type III domain-containing protein 10 n=2 Tax=Astyanax mexicanus TaxID=7994 RepID=A0A8B9RJH6_ASTMX|nr:fibronectin type III domain-containing protein 10 [Astyanax mexicanus]
MSGLRSALLSWVALLLYLSSMTLAQQRKSSGINERAQSYSQGAPVNTSTELYSKQNNGSVWISMSEVNQRTANAGLTSAREASEKATASERVANIEHSEKLPNERSASENAASEKVLSERKDTERTASERVFSAKAIRKRATNDRTLNEQTTIARATTEKATNDEDAGTLCAYRVVEKGEEGRLCFRHTQVGFTCPSSTCRQVRSPGGNLLANMLSNGSVLLQWTYDGRGRSSIPGSKGVPSEAPELTVTPAAGGDRETLPAPPKSPNRGQQMQGRGFRMSCWWNGSYTQFECASVTLGNSCRDFLLTELHENMPYRICLQPLWAVWDGAEAGRLHKDKMKTIWDEAGCVDFSISPSGMQDIVIAMTTVGGAICVMLVIICLLVAYITENIMSPSVQHTLTARHSTRSHNTHL